MISNTAANFKTERLNRIQGVAVQSPDMNLTELLRWDVQRAVYKQLPQSLNELKQQCKDDWANIRPDKARD